MEDSSVSIPTAGRQLLVPLLAVAATMLAVVMLAKGYSTQLEAFGVVTGALCVWLTVRASVWNFPVSLANVVAFSFVFFRARLFADAGLQVVFFVLTLAGWYWWLFGGQGRSALRVARTGLGEMIGVGAGVTASTLGLWLVLSRYGGSASFFDALTTSLSLGAQWLLNRKRVENWWFWIVADVIYVPLYVYKHLYLTAFLYAVFLAMATAGLIEWVRLWRREQASLPPRAPLPLPRAFEVIAGPAAAATTANEQVPA